MKTRACVGLAVLFALFGCTGCQRQTEIPDAPEVSPKAEVKGDPALSAYSDKLSPILVTRDGAAIKWRDAVRDAGKKPREEMPAALLEATDQYAKALDKTRTDLSKLTPPPAAKGVHDVLLRLFTKLGDNIDSTVAAMHSDGSEDASQLVQERKRIEIEGADELHKALIVGGFDVHLFQTKAELRLQNATN